MGRISHGTLVGVHLPDIVEARQPDIAHAYDVVHEVPTAIPQDREAGLDVGHPELAALLFAGVEATELPAAAECVELSTQWPRPAVESAGCNPHIGEVAEALGQLPHSGQLRTELLGTNGFPAQACRACGIDHIGEQAFFRIPVRRVQVQPVVQTAQPGIRRAHRPGGTHSGIRQEVVLIRGE